MKLEELSEDGGVQDELAHGSVQNDATASNDRHSHVQHPHHYRPDLHHTRLPQCSQTTSPAMLHGRRKFCTEHAIFPLVAFALPLLVSSPPTSGLRR